MGLAAHRKRTKLAHDPNNTAWTSNTQTFGHKILGSHGWTPGQYLGPKDASHAELHTSANASHVRVVLKDDNLGLGAKIGSGVGQGECTGLDAFKDLLGRLNGKEESEIYRERTSREDLKRAIYSERKWGTLRFVKGGFLVGEKIESSVDGQDTKARKSSDAVESGEELKELVQESVTEAKKSRKKRKREQEGMESEGKAKKSKKQGNRHAETEAISPTNHMGPMEVEPKKSKRQRREDRAMETIITTESSKIVGIDSKKAKKTQNQTRKEATPDVVAVKVTRSKEKKMKKKRLDVNPEEDADTPIQDVQLSGTEVTPKEEALLDPEETDTKSKRRKKEKKQREHNSPEPTTSLAKDIEPPKSKAKKRKDDPPLDVLPSPQVTAEIPLHISTESSGRSTPIMRRRHAVRSRNIAQKRLASMDVASLNQIFMIKS